MEYLIRFYFILILCLSFRGGKSEKNMETMIAKWDGVIIAESANCVIVEGNHYFPPDSIKSEYFTESDKTTICGWKGTASYYDVKVNGKVNKDAAWYYPDTKPAADNIKGMVAFWKGVQVQKASKGEL